MTARTPSAGAADRRPPGRVRAFLTPGRIVALLVTAATLVFVFQNTRQTRIRLLVPEVVMPLWVALLGTLLIGLLVGGYLGYRHGRR
ncbi:hypothetical protein GCM10027160_48690 [Streptomyces calidiresistens]|uniref:hypothetical protein n=1 Tax=Streptomyces calidiresistens TaxID=1485586 RepID=UPI001E618EAD|nr:hypothetical protein [Streptomyces calidiresistens]